MVLWVSLLLAAIAGGFVLDTRTSTRLARNAVDNGMARSLADGGIHQAVFALLDAEPERRWKRDGRAYDVTVEGGSLIITVEDEGGKVDLNRSSEILLENLFRAGGVPEMRIPEMVDALLGQAETQDRGRTGAQPERNPMIAVDALRQLPGITDQLYRVLRPAVTVYGSGSGIQVQTAPRLALLALPGVTADTVDRFIAARGQDDPGIEIERLLGNGPARRYWLRAPTRFVRITALAITPNGARFSRSAIVELIDHGEQPFIIREWREGETIERPSDPNLESSAGDGV